MTKKWKIRTETILPRNDFFKERALEENKDFEDWVKDIMGMKDDVESRDWKRERVDDVTWKNEMETMDM